MTIRTRLSLWYTGVLMASLLFMGGVMYYELVVERRATKAARLKKEPMEDEVREIVLYYGLPTVFITIGVGWWLLRQDLAPLHALTRAAERLHAFNLCEPLPRTGRGVHFLYTQGVSPGVLGLHPENSEKTEVYCEIDRPKAVGVVASSGRARRIDRRDRFRLLRRFYRYRLGCP